MQDATKVLMGGAKTSSKQVTWFDAAPATFVAGLAVRLKSDNTLSVTKADGKWLGISVGKNLSNISKGLGIARKGLGIPVLLEAQPAKGTITIDDYTQLVSGTEDAVTVGATAFTFQTGAVTPGQATAQAATDNATTAASLAAQINAHATAGALVVATAVGAVVTITAKANTTAGNAIALTYTDNDTNEGLTITNTTDDKLAGGGGAPTFVTKGEKVYFSDTSGKADDPNSAATISNAVYTSGVLTGIDESGTEVYAALVDMPGGL